MLKSKRLICLVVALVFATSIAFTGCGTKEGPKAAETKTATVAPTAAPEEVKPEFVKLTWYTAGQADADPAELKVVHDELNKILKEKLNCEIEWHLYGFSELTEKMPLHMASKDQVDIMFTSSWSNFFYPMHNQGAFMAIDEYLKETPKLVEAIPEFVWPAGKIAGKQYAVPNYQKFFDQWALCFRKDYVEKNGFDVSTVKSLADVEPYLKLVKENEPTSLNAANISFEYYLKYEGIGTSLAGLKKDGSNGMKVVNVFETEEFKRDMATRRDWFKKGYIRKDVLTVEKEDADKKAGKYSIISESYKPGIEAELKKNLTDEYVVVPINEPYVTAAEGNATMNAIGAFSANPVRALQVLELMNTDKEIYNLKIFGIENVHYKKVADNRVEAIADKKYAGYMPGWALGNQFNAFYTSEADGTWENTIKINTTAKVSPVRGFVLDTKSIEVELTKVNAVTDEYLNTLIWGAIDYEARYQEFLNKLKMAGSEELLAKIQKQIDDWAATK